MALEFDIAIQNKVALKFKIVGKSIKAAKSQMAQNTKYPPRPIC